MAEGWARDYVTESYRLWFEEGVSAGAEPNLSDSLRATGQEPKAVLTRATAAEAVERLATETEKAAALGVFGSPTLWSVARFSAGMTGSTMRCRGSDTAA